MSKYLVTGGAGFIGSHLTEFLVKKGHKVRVLDDLSTGKIKNLSAVAGKFELVRGDIRDPRIAAKACKGIDTVFHLAALASVPESFKEPKRYTAVNFEGTRNLLKAAVENGVKRFVFSSSSAVYGNSSSLRQKEKGVARPLSPYAKTKLMGERECRNFTARHGLQTVCLRYFNVFGPRQANNQYAGVITAFIKLLKSNKRPLIFGDGHQTRDFVYVENVVTANYLAAKKPGIKHAVFNVASGKSVTILHLLGTLKKLLRRDLEPEFLPFRPGDVYKSSADISAIRKGLRYKPQIGFEKGLSLTLK